MLRLLNIASQKFHHHYLRFIDKKNNKDYVDFIMLNLLLIPTLLHLGIKKYIPVITKYYPFSLLFQDKLIHFRYTKERNLSDYIEKAMAKKSYYFTIKGVEQDRYFIIFYGLLKNRTKKADNALLKIIESKLKLEKHSIYLRDSDSNILRIMVPKEYILKS